MITGLLYNLAGLPCSAKIKFESISGKGGIFVHLIDILNNQKGCIKYSYFPDEKNRIPQNFACVNGSVSKLIFVSEIFGSPYYAQLSLDADFNIRERGPGDDQMGAYGFLLEAHKWRNIKIRFRDAACWNKTAFNTCNLGRLIMKGDFSSWYFDL